MGTVSKPKSPKAKAKPAALLDVRVPSEDELAAVAEQLSAADRELFAALLDRLTVASGSREVARLWLVTPSPEFETVPLDEVRNGQTAALLRFVESRSEAAPPHA